MWIQWGYESADLERLWSPTPIYAYKFYTHVPRRGALRTMFGDLLHTGVEYERSCVHTRWQADYDVPKRFCEGEWPNVVHTHTFPDGRVMQLEGPTCGFYGYKLDGPPRGTYVWYEEVNKVMALVELSGIVVEHEHGYRAEKLKIIDWKGLPVKEKGFEDSWNEIVETYRKMWHDYYYGNRADSEL